MKKETDRIMAGVATGFATGAVAGVIIGILKAEPALWIALGTGGGIALGALLGWAFSCRK